MEFVDSWHVGCLAEHIQAHLEGNDELKKLIINIPPGHSKTRICTIFASAWDWLHRPFRGTLLATNSQDLCYEIGDAIRSLITSEWYSSYWIEDKNIFKPSKTNWNKTVFSNDKNGRFQVVTPGGQTTGKSATHRLVIDDLNDLKNYLNINALKSDSEWNDSTLYNRARSSDVLKLCVQQRVNEEYDITAHLLQQELGWFRLVLPNEYTKHFTFRSPIGYDDPRKDGELLCPQRFNEDYFYPIKQKPIIYQAAYQQDPKLPKGGLINPNWIKYYLFAPTKYDQLIVSIDLASKVKADNDYSVFLVLGKIDQKVYVVDVIREKLTYAEQYELMLTLSNKYPELGAKLIEDKSNGTTLIETLQKFIPGIIPVDPGNKLNKETRLAACIPYFLAGNIYFPDPKKYNWIKDSLEELITFPASKHNDFCDSMSQGLEFLYKHSYNTTFTIANNIKPNMFNEQIVVSKDFEVTNKWGIKERISTVFD